MSGFKLGSLNRGGIITGGLKIKIDKRAVGENFEHFEKHVSYSY